MWSRLGTLNAVAVLPAYRGKKFQAIDLGWTGSAAKLLMLFAIHQMEKQGLRAALATTGNVASTQLFRHLGFRIIDCPRPIPHLHPDIVATNVGIVFGSPQHLHAQRKCAIPVNFAQPLDTDSLMLLKYFAEREAEALRSVGIDPTV